MSILQKKNPDENIYRKSSKYARSDILSESSVERHDQYNFEVKMDYTLNKKQKYNVYSLNTYFFIPKQLEINKDNYTKEDFFSNISNYIRFKTPKISLAGLLSKNNTHSPISNICSKLFNIESSMYQPEDVEFVNRELRLLGCIVKTSIRDQMEQFHVDFKRFKESNEVFERYSLYLKDIASLQNKMREMEREFYKVQIPLELRDSFKYTDDWISLQIEGSLTKALKVFRSKMPENVIEETKKLILYEQEHRRRINSNVILNKSGSNEAFTYWESILKKFTQQVLYLDVRSKNQKNSATEILHSIAAGIAMFISLFFGLIFASRFETNSIPYIATFVVIYMLKDRIKENFRRISNKAVGILFPDRIREIYDWISEENEEKIGKLKESMHFMEWNEVPFDIIRLREMTNKSPIERMGKPENVFQYKKKVKLFTQKIIEHHTRHGDISDITRFNVKDLIKFADDPIRYELLLEPEEKIPISVTAAKVYHLNVIFELSTIDETNNVKTYYRKVRVILDQKGIKRVMEPKIE